MSAAPTPMPPPPGGPGPTTAPTSPIAASPAPATPNPQAEKASGNVIRVVQSLRAIAQDFPATAKDISQINDLMRNVQMTIMKGSPAGEPAAPPIGG